MATESSKTQTTPAPQAAAPAKAASAQAAPEAKEPEVSFRGYPQPIVVRLGKKKRRYSSSLKGLQRRMRGGVKVSDKILDALSSGLGKYRRRSNRSADKKKDGVLKDFLKNSAAGLGTTLRKSSKVPVMLAKSLRSKRAGKRQMRLLKAFARGLR